MIRVKLPHHLRTLAQVNGEIEVEVAAPVTQRSILDAVEKKYPVLVGTIRDRETHKRRSLLRFFASNEDWTHESPDAPLPDVIVNGKEPFIVVGAMAGGS